MSNKKASQELGIQFRKLKIKLHTFYITTLITNYHVHNTLMILKIVDATPVFKKDDNYDKTNYRQRSVLSNFNKVYEKLLQNQMCPNLDNFFSKYQCGFRKSFNAQHCLMSLIEK